MSRSGDTRGRSRGRPTVWRATKYDPSDRDERGHYLGSEDTGSDHGPVESAYLATVTAFAACSRIDVLQIREPSVPIVTGMEVSGERFAGLADLFGAALDGYHDGAGIPWGTARELVRSMLRSDGVWCRLEAGDDFFVHVGWDQYVYVGSTSDCSTAVAFAEQQGLFAEPFHASPYAFDASEDGDGEVRPADAAFWSDLTELVVRAGAVLLEEGHVHNHARWHRLTPGNLRRIRAALTPRSRLLVWPDLHADVSAVLESLPDGLAEIVWQDRNGQVNGRLVEAADHPHVRTHLRNASAATVLSAYADDRRPLSAAVLPDPDGVLRARWRP